MSRLCFDITHPPRNSTLQIAEIAGVILLALMRATLMPPVDPRIKTRLPPTEAALSHEH